MTDADLHGANLHGATLTDAHGCKDNENLTKKQRDGAHC
ncbi:MAG: pentapeptide repeat-containing protein [Acidobacteriaceae bacterium]